MRSSSGGSKFQSTPSARRATCWICSHREHHYNFNPRPPRGERRRRSRGFSAASKFQSTPSARRATTSLAKLKAEQYTNFNPRPPRGERPRLVRLPRSGISVFQSTPSARRATVDDQQVALVRVISIHALREESDGRRVVFAPGYYMISIHALREESDFSMVPILTGSTNFNPRPPRGERRAGSRSRPWWS